MRGVWLLAKLYPLVQSDVRPRASGQRRGFVGELAGLPETFIEVFVLQRDCSRLSCRRSRATHLTNCAANGCHLHMRCTCFRLWLKAHAAGPAFRPIDSRGFGLRAAGKNGPVALSLGDSGLHVGNRRPEAVLVPTKHLEGHLGRYPLPFFWFKVPL